MFAVYKDQKKIECLELKQNDLSVVDYEVQLVKLLKFTHEEVATGNRNRRDFKGG